jgi:protein TonB
MPTKKARLRFLDRSKPGRALPLVAAGTFPHLQNLKLSAYDTLALAKRGDRIAQNRLVSAAVGLSIVVHGILLAIRFVVAEDRRPATTPPLEVVLVNSKSSTKPYKAQVLAQANLDGGGNTDQQRRAKSPLPLLPKDSQSNELSAAAQRVQMLEEQAQQLLSQSKSKSAVNFQPKKVETPEPSQLPTSQQDLNQRMLEAIRLEAQIARDLEAYQQRPKKRFIGARAEEYRFARYVEDWRMKVERVGNLNYPEAARAQKLYGSLVLTVEIRADGSIESIVVDKPSGRKILDAAALRIVQLAAPYAAFPPEIRRDTDILSITRTWSFTRGEEGMALSAPPP